jgi:hypothetical protein
MWGRSKNQLEKVLGTDVSIATAPKINLREELERRRSLEAKLLFLLQTQKVITTRELRNFGTGCSSRLFALRKEGHKISAVYQAPGQYKYIYRGFEEEK